MKPSDDTSPPSRHRRSGFIIGSMLRCACGHRLAEKTVLLARGIMRCDYKAHPTAGECGRCLYITVSRLPGGRRMRFACEVTAAEAQHLRDGNVDEEVALAYLGLMLDAPPPPTRPPSPMTARPYHRPA